MRIVVSHTNLIGEVRKKARILHRQTETLNSVNEEITIIRNEKLSDKRGKSIPIAIFP